MNKRILPLAAILLIMAILTGCGHVPDAEVPATESPATESLPDVSGLPLLEQGIGLEESSNLRYIPNGAVEGMIEPEVRLLGHGLLLSECNGGEVILKHISLEDGALLNAAAVSAADGTKLYIGSGEIGLCDRTSGLISILDTSFRLNRTYEVPVQGDDWYLNSELDTLYIFFRDRGLLIRKLESGEEAWLVDNGSHVTVKGGGSSCLIFTYTDRADQRLYTRCVNLSTATLETLPVDDFISAGSRQGDTWLLQGGEAEGFYMLMDGASAQSFVCADSTARLLSPKRHLLLTDVSRRNLFLYETDGSFLSRCALPLNSNGAAGPDFVWSGYWEGYFFVDFIDSTCRLMFWDVGAAAEGEDLQLSPLETVQESRPLVDAQLYERAEELSGRFGVDIRIAEQCTLDYSHYDTYALTDPVFIRFALDVLEQSLSKYPEGFFRQLPYGSVESIRIELVGGLMAKDGVDTHPASIGAFAQDRGSYYSIVLDGFLIQQQTLFHEISHIIDAKLEWDSLMRGDALFSGEVWLSLQPAGFRYAMTYTEVPEELLRYMESDCFITAYSMTFPTEDRAVLMASAMENNSWDFTPDSGRREKLRYYAACMRDCFDTAGWPEVTSWEQVLQ